MERSKEIQSGLKKMATVLFLAAALASTGCGQNALLNPTADQVQAAGSGSASTAGNVMNPAGNTMHP
jgi:hypothetical protein